jgi:hypothetical protein
MTERPRRFAVLVVFVVASAAVLATTPSIPTSTLEDSESTSVDVTPDEPDVRPRSSRRTSSGTRRIS